MTKTIWVNRNNDIPNDQKEEQEWLNDWYESLCIRGTINNGCPWCVWKGYGGWFCKETEEKCVFSTPCFFKCDIYERH